MKFKHSLWCMIVVITCFHVDRGAALSCLNEFGQSVDWFVIYKIPKLKSSVKPFDSGRSYVYFTSDQAKDDEWQLSPNLIHQDSSLLARTLNQVYRNVRNSTYIQYNDEPPLSIRHVAGANAHAKGVLALGKSSGFWIVHSIPKFPPPFESESYAYPNSGTIYGQSVLCVSISTARQADHVLQQLLIMRPIVYASGQSDAVSVLNWDAVVSGDWSPMGRDTIPIESIDRLRFVSIVKSPLARFELYAEQVAPLLATDLLVQTWRNGIGDPLNSTCDLKFKVNNVDAVRVAFDLGAATIKTFAHASNVSSHSNVMQPLIARLTNRVSDIWRKRWRRPAYDGLTVRSIQWPFHDDHSKWAVGSVSSDPFVCIGDLNRMRSQAKRGGGTVCVRNSALWKLFYRQVEATEPCRRTLTDVAFQEGTTITSVNINTTITS